MNFKTLKDYNLENVLSPMTEKVWSEATKELKCKSYIDIYKVFLLITNEKVENLCLITNQEIKNNFFNHVRQLLGFILVEFEGSKKTIDVYYRTILKILNYIYIKHLDIKSKDYNFDKEIPYRNILKECVPIYKNNYINKSKKEYFEGWNAYSSDHKLINLNYSYLHDKFGDIFFKKFIKGVSTILSKFIYRTAQRILIRINKLIFYISELSNDLNELKKNTSAEYAHTFFIKIYKIQLIDIKIKNQDIGLFHEYWRSQISIYMDLVNINVFPPPIMGIITPNFKSSSKKQINIKIKGSKEIFHSKLITQIPISISDDKAIEAILEKIRYDINFITRCSELEIRKIKKKMNDFYFNASKGQIKERERSSTNYNPVKVGENNQENLCATYLSTPFQNEDIVDFKKFLGFTSTKSLKEKIFYCSNDTLYPFLILLIHEHPFITESWLTNFKIYDEKSVVGYFQKNGDWYFSSLKKRRGIELAEQSTKTTQVSKDLFESIFEITKIGRDYLKKFKSPDREYLLIASWSPFIIPKKIQTIYHPNTLKNNNHLKNIFYNNMYAQDYVEKYGMSELVELVENFTLTKFRASCAVKVYLETKSIYEMSKVLGHKEYNQNLMKSYLPEPLWKFFTTRWIRIFQNALVYEAMKDSEHLFQAVDFNKEQLNEFIENHSFRDLPYQIDKYKNKNLEAQNINEKIGIFPISVALLQWFIGINEYILSNGLEALNEIAEHWWQSAMLVVTQLELSLDPNINHSAPIEHNVLKMYQKAKKHPISLKLIEGALK